MKKLFLTLCLALLLCVFFTVLASAQSVYLEKIPSELTFEGDTVTHFVVFEEEKYYTGTGSTISGFNTDQMEADMVENGIDPSKIGSEYLTRFNVPAYLNGTLVTYVNLNSMKTHKYFSNKCGYVQLAGTVNQIHDMNEKTAQLRCFDFGENSQITKIPAYFACGSQRLYSLKNFPKYLTVIEDNAFNKCYNAFSGEVYLNAVTIQASAFNNAFNHTTGLVFGPDTKNIGNQSLCVRLSEVPNAFRPAGEVLPLSYIEFQCDVSEISFATQGTNLGAFYFTGTSRSPYSNLTCIILSHPNNASKITEGSVFNDFTAEGVTILFNDSDGLNDYVTAAHSVVAGDMVYDDFLKCGSKLSICQNCSFESAETIPAIFTSLGYSASTYSIAFSIGYSVNLEAKNAYEEYTGFSVSYGIVVAAKANLGASMPLDENGNAITLSSGMVINAPLGGTPELFFGIVSGFSTDTQKDAQIVLCAYALVRDEAGELANIAYLQDGTADDGSLFSTSYNSIANK